MSGQEEKARKTEDQLIDLAVEGWRFSRVVTRALTNMDAGEGERHASRLRYFAKRIETTLADAGFRLVSVEGQRFEPGIAATPINAGDFGSGAVLVVDQMIEPIVMQVDGELRRQGTVLLREAKS